jgi:hypothetical protein
MPIKLGNNARAHLAAPLADDGSTIVLNEAEAATFPSLAVGEWFPMTLADADGHLEVVKVTERSANILTVTRAQEATEARAWLAGDRAEIRLTAGVIDQVRIEGEQFASTAATNAKNTANSYTDSTATTLRGELNSAIAGERSTSAGEIASLTTTVNTKFPTAGGTITGNTTVTGDITTYRPASPTTGVIFFGNAGNRYLFYDGTNYNMPSAQLYVNGSQVWHGGNFNPANYLPLSGGTISGSLQINSGAPQINLYDTDWGMRYLHCNGGNVGFLNNGGGWACYSSNDGSFVATGNIGAYSDRKHKKHIKTLKDGLWLVEQLRGVRYVDRRTGAARVGVIAQEVREVLPEVVGEGVDGLHVDYGNIVGPLVEAVKALAARVKKLEGG